MLAPCGPSTESLVLYSLQAMQNSLPPFFIALSRVSWDAGKKNNIRDQPNLSSHTLLSFFPSTIPLHIAVQLSWASRFTR